MKKRAWRVAPVAAAALVAVLGLWFGRTLVEQPGEPAVRHGVSTTATVTAVSGDHATVRYFTPDGPIVSRIPTLPGRAYAAGDTLGVVYDPYWQRHVSERGLPPPVGAGPRLLMVLLTLAAAIAGYVLLERLRPPDLGDHRVAGGRERAGVPQPEPASA